MRARFEVPFVSLESPQCSGFLILRHGLFWVLKSGSISLLPLSYLKKFFATFRLVIRRLSIIPVTFRTFAFIHGPRAPPWRVSDPDMHYGTCVTHVPWCLAGSLTSGCLWGQRLGKRSRHSRRMRNPQLYVSGKRPIVIHVTFLSL